MAVSIAWPRRSSVFGQDGQALKSSQADTRFQSGTEGEWVIFIYTRFLSMLRVRRGETRVLRISKIGEAKKSAFTNAALKRDRDVTAYDFIDYYATLLGLTREQRNELNHLTQDEAALQQTIRDYALIWNRRRATGTTDVLIRRSLLVRLVMGAVKTAITEGNHTRVEGAYALALCDQIQIYADALAKAAGGTPPELSREEGV
jgi:hypothetical protein